MYSFSKLITFSFLSQTEYRGDDEWHRDQLSVQVEAHLRAELEESQKQLKCAHDAQQEQKNKIQSLRYSSTPSPQLDMLYKNTVYCQSLGEISYLFFHHYLSVTHTQTCFHTRQPKVIKKVTIGCAFLRLAVEEGEEAMRREQTRVQELQQQLEQERALSLRKDREEDERRGVR